MCWFLYRFVSSQTLRWSKIYFAIYGDFCHGRRGLVIKVTKVCCTLYYQSCVYSLCINVKRVVMVEEIFNATRFETRKVCIVCDNQSVTRLSKNSSFHSRSMHIDVCYRWIHDTLDSKLMEIEKIHTDENGSDMFMKVFPKGSLSFYAR